MSLFSRNTKPSDLAPDPALVAEVRAYLLRRYEQRLNQKLASRQPVNLRILPFQKDQTSAGGSDYMTLKEDEVRDEIGHIFNRAYGRLLIVGLPGSGKTTLVIQLALHILELENKSMPVVLNLATWRAEFKTFEEWLRKILPAELGASQKLAEQIWHNTPLILLLDGLDEVPEADRASCLTAIGEYGANPKHQFLISSRIAEYAATKDAPVNAQIEVAPLTIDQVEFGLTASVFLEPESKRLLNALKTDPVLRQAVESPFYLNTAQLLFASGKNWSEFGFVAEDVTGRQRELVEQFVEGTLTRKAEKDYPADKAQHWLSFLASRMTSRNMVVFELQDLQYDWWKWGKGQILFANNIKRLVFGLPIGLVLGLVVGLVILPETHIVVLFGKLHSVLNSGSAGKFVFTFFYMLFFVLFLVLFLEILLGWFFGWFLTVLIGGLVSNLYVDILFMLIGGLFGISLFVRQDSKPPYILTKNNIEWSLKKFFINRKWVLIFMLICILILGLFGRWNDNQDLGLKLTKVLFFALLFLLLLGLLDFINERIIDIIQISTPYQRFHASNRALHFSILQHKLLCYQLRKRGLLPPDLVNFLNEMSRRHLLEFDGDPTTGIGGGAWRFRHRILQDYFAGLWVEPKA